MRFGIDGSLIGAEPRGMGYFALRLVAWLTERSDSTETVVFSWGEPDIEEHLEQNITRFRVPKTIMPIYEQICLPIWASRAGVDVLVCPFNTGPILMSPGIDTILVVHDTIFMRSPLRLRPSRNMRQNAGRLYRRAVCPRVVKEANLIVTRSDVSRQRICARWSIEEQQVVIVRGESRLSGTEAMRWTDAAKKCSIRGRYVFHLGGDAPHKNTGLVVNAVRQLWRSNVNVGLVVAGVRRPSVFGGDQSNARGWIRFVPYLSDEVLKAVYQNASLFVLVSEEEGFGEPIVEAMNEGVPLVLSDIPVFREVAGSAARYVERDRSSIAAGIKELWQDESIRVELSDRSAARARDFSDAKARGSFLEAVDSACDGQRKRNCG